MSFIEGFMEFISGDEEWPKCEIQKLLSDLTDLNVEVKLKVTVNGKI